MGNPILGNPRLLNTKLLNTNSNLEEEETTQGVDVEQEIIKTYKDCISSKISNREFKILADLQETIGKELLKKAIILAVMKNCKNVGYIQAVIEDWNKKGFTTLEQVNTYLLEWLSMNKKSKENRIKQIKKKAENKSYEKKESLFNDYEQREYDFVDLEKRLLGWESK